MSWIFVLAGAVVLVLALVWTRSTPSGTRRVRGTRLMKMGQIFLAGAVIAALLLGLGAWLST
ncbi:MAG: hypothetical protein H6746_19310 [Deltaproteobacteria bacterium]|nr:hypothetical protein [Deltaproteobacteria bacterium]